VIVELAALFAIIVLPVSLLLGSLTVIGLGIASLAVSDLDEGRLLRGQTH
jgi:hypothetical protein